MLVNCVRGKEKKCGQELLEIFNGVSSCSHSLLAYNSLPRLEIQIADLLYPETKLDQSDDEGEEKVPVKAKTMEEELEADIEGMKKDKEKKVYRFSEYIAGSGRAEVGRSPNVHIFPQVLFRPLWNAVSYFHLDPAILRLICDSPVIYINVKQPIDPNRIIQHYLKSIEQTGVTQTRCGLASA